MYLYENSIIEDINSLFTNSKVRSVIANSLDEGFRRVAAENKDVLSLPCIILTGGDWVILDSNFYNIMHGSENKRIENNTVSKNISCIPFRPNYDMYIVASSSRECDMLTREIIFHYSQNPTLTVKIPYGLDMIHTFNLTFDTNVRKNQNSSGFVYRTLSFYLDGAYLWHNNSMNVIKEINTDVKEVMEEIV